MRTCEHITSNEEFCGSPALRGRAYCYFHLTYVGRRLRTQKQVMNMECPPLELPALEDANSIQLALMQVMDALIHGRINTKVSGQLLYGLQIASSNLWQGANFEQGKSATVVGRYDSFEQDYDLADTACELTVAEEDQEEAVVEDDSELACAVREAKLVRLQMEQRAAAAKGQAADAENEPEETSVAADSENESQEDDFFDKPFDCGAAYKLMCIVNGPLSGRHRDGTSEPRRIKRDAVSQRLTLRVQPQSVAAQFTEESREVA
jgi:hypothetical protein